MRGVYAPDWNEIPAMRLFLKSNVSENLSNRVPPAIRARWPKLCYPRYSNRSAAVERLDEESGVGLLTAAVFLAEMGDLNRFSNRRKVAACFVPVSTPFPRCPRTATERRNDQRCAESWNYSQDQETAEKLFDSGNSTV